MRRRAVVGWLVVASLLIASCGSSMSDEVTGIVTEVDGDLVTVERFVVVAPSSESFTFEPAPGLLFDDRAPLSHLQDHVRSGEPVTVRFEVGDDGTLVAVEVGDAG